MSQRMTVPLKLTQLRFLVGALGERVGWWSSSFTGEIGLRWLAIPFPRTALRAALESVTVAARRHHDERLRQRDIHLFRLGHVQEDTIAHHLAQGSARLVAPPAEVSDILAKLDELGPPDPAPPPVGPCSLGDEERAQLHVAVADLARVYAAAARNGQQAIPYFEVDR